MKICYTDGFILQQAAGNYFFVNFWATVCTRASIQPFGHNSVGCHSPCRNISTNYYLVVEMHTVTVVQYAQMMCGIF